MTTEEKPTPELLDALQSVVQERGWTLTSDGGNGVYSAELIGPSVDPQVSSASADGLVRAINAFDTRMAQTKPSFLTSHPRTVITGPLDLEDVQR
jgi:hypothetical protein